MDLSSPAISGLPRLEYKVVLNTRNGVGRDPSIVEDFQAISA